MLGSFCCEGVRGWRAILAVAGDICRQGWWLEGGLGEPENGRYGVEGFF